MCSVNCSASGGQPQLGRRLPCRQGSATSGCHAGRPRAARSRTACCAFVAPAAAMAIWGVRGLGCGRGLAALPAALGQVALPTCSSTMHMLGRTQIRPCRGSCTFHPLQVGGRPGAAQRQGSHVPHALHGGRCAAVGQPDSAERMAALMWSSTSAVAAAASCLSLRTQPGTGPPVWPVNKRLASGIPPDVCAPCAVHGPGGSYPERGSSESPRHAKGTYLEKAPHAELAIAPARRAGSRS